MALIGLVGANAVGQEAIATAMSVAAQTAATNTAAAATVGGTLAVASSGIVLAGILAVPVLLIGGILIGKVISTIRANRKRKQLLKSSMLKGEVRDREARMMFRRQRYGFKPPVFPFSEDEILAGNKSLSSRRQQRKLNKIEIKYTKARSKAGKSMFARWRMEKLDWKYFNLLNNSSRQSYTQSTHLNTNSIYQEAGQFNHIINIRTKKGELIPYIVRERSMFSMNSPESQKVFEYVKASFSPEGNNLSMRKKTYGTKMTIAGDPNRVLRCGFDELGAYHLLDTTLLLRVKSLYAEAYERAKGFGNNQVSEETARNIAAGSIFPVSIERGMGSGKNYDEEQIRSIEQLEQVLGDSVRSKLVAQAEKIMGGKVTGVAIETPSQINKSIKKEGKRAAAPVVESFDPLVSPVKQ